MEEMKFRDSEGNVFSVLSVMANEEYRKVYILYTDSKEYKRFFIGWVSEENGKKVFNPIEDSEEFEKIRDMFEDTTDYVIDEFKKNKSTM